jgi:DNA polymerase-3 subunit epsilon
MSYIVGLDIETTGLDVKKGHKIIEIALLTYDLQTRELVEAFVRRIDPQRPIDHDSQEVHGIAYTDLIGQPTWGLLFTEILMRINRADLIVAHNAEFDIPFVQAQMQGNGVFINPARFCTAENGRWATFNGKTPRLGELCFALDVDYDPASAHSASYDVEVTMDCFFKGVDRGVYLLPEELLEQANV